MGRQIEAVLNPLLAVDWTLINTELLFRVLLRGLKVIVLVTRTHPTAAVLLLALNDNWLLLVAC